VAVDIVIDFALGR